MTEDENCRIRPTEEKELRQMYHDEFFIKLLVFTERLEQRAEEAKSLGNKN